jgi:ribonuclease III
MAQSDPRRQKQLEKLIARLGLPPSSPINWELLDLAMTHPTVVPEFNYDRLEFLGDAVVRLVVAEFLREHYPQQSVGEWSAVRSVLVSDRTLARLADSYGLDRYLLLGNSAIGDPAGQTSRLADCFEALLAALYLSSQNFKLIRPWLDAHWQQLAEEVRSDPAYQNYKAALQAWTQSHYQALPEYRTAVVANGLHPPLSIDNGVDRFRSEVWFQGELLGHGTGNSKKEAEKAAAQSAYLHLVEGLNPEELS